MLWERIFNSIVLHISNLILGGNLDSTLNYREILGDSAQLEPLVEFFNSKLERLELVDLEPFEIRPTWVNNKTRPPVVAKRMDRLLIHSQMIGGGSRMRSWIHKLYFSYNVPIFLDISEENAKPGV